MSKLKWAASPRVTIRALRFIAASTVRPSTNCSPMIRIACIIAARITGSPLSRTSEATKARGPFWASFGAPITRPVSMRPQVEAFTSQLSD